MPWCQAGGWLLLAVGSSLPLAPPCREDTRGDGAGLQGQGAMGAMCEFPSGAKVLEKTCCTFRCCHIDHARTQLMACSWEMRAGASMTVTYFGWEPDGSVVKSTYAFAIVAYCVWKDCPMPQPFQSIPVRFTKYEISETDCFKTLLTQPCNIMRIEQSSAKFSWLKS